MYDGNMIGAEEEHIPFGSIVDISTILDIHLYHCYIFHWILYVVVVSTVGSGTQTRY
jgi:hypothetical protein